MSDKNARRSTLSVGMLGTVALTLAVLIIGGVLGYLNARRLDGNRRLVSHSHEVVQSLDALLSNLKDAETGQRGYLLTGEERYLEPYDAALSKVALLRQRLTVLIADNPGQIERLRALEATGDDKLAELKQTITLMRSGDKLGALVIVRDGSGKNLMDDMRRKVAAMEQVEADLLQARDRQTDASYRATVAAIALSTLLGVFLTGVVFYAFHLNLTREQHAAGILSEEKERLRTTLASIGDAVIATDHRANVSFLNPVAEQLTGWTSAQAAGVPLTEVFNIVNETTRLAVENPAIRALREGVIVGLANHTVLIAKNGAEWPIDDSAAPIRRDDGSVAGCVLVFRDITERKRDDEELRRLAAELSEADRRKDEFLATLAHELRNPLAPIRTGLQILQGSRVGTEDQDRVRKMIERQTDQLVRLVDDLMDVSRITRGTLELRKERIELATVLQHAVETARPLIEARGHTLSVNLPSAPMFINADTTRLGQVFANLLNNAAKYSEPGGRISLSAERRGNELWTTVKDSGIGIPADMLSRIFEMFAQVDKSLEKSHGGLGIGLTLAKRLTEMHGGTLEVSSDGPGRGSEFVVRLPAALAGVAEARPQDAGTTLAESGVRSRILVADDNEDSVTTLAMLLETFGQEVHTASDGLEAVRAAASFAPDVAILDIGMPGLNGYEACRAIRAQPGREKIVMIALSGWGQEEDKRRSQEAGFDYHLVKPVDPAALMQLLAKLRP